MSTNKTIPTGQSVSTFLTAVVPERRALQARQLDGVFQRATGFEPQMWGESIVGYGRYHYVYNSGRSGDFLATGFAVRKGAFSLYIMPGYQDYGAILSRLGKHKTGKSCLYVNKLQDIELDVLEELIRAGVQDLGRMWTVFPV